MKRLIVGSLAACATVFLAAAPALAGDVWVGTWKLNKEKSKFVPGPARQSQTLKFEPAEGGIKLSTDSVDADGKAVQGGYVAKFDGTEVAFAGNPEADTAAPKRVDANHYTNTWNEGQPRLRYAPDSITCVSMPRSIGRCRSRSMPCSRTSRSGT
jgi:hypothetical protein